MSAASAERAKVISPTPMVALELSPGYTKLVRPARTAQTALISDAGIAEATILSSKLIAVTGKKIGLANLILVDEAGVQIANLRVQVVGRTDFRVGAVVPVRREIRVRNFGIEGKGSEKTFLCAEGCAPMPFPP